MSNIYGHNATLLQFTISIKSFWVRWALWHSFKQISLLKKTNFWGANILHLCYSDCFLHLLISGPIKKTFNWLERGNIYFMSSIGEGMDEMEFTEAESNMNDLVTSWICQNLNEFKFKCTGEWVSAVSGRTCRGRVLRRGPGDRQANVKARINIGFCDRQEKHGDNMGFYWFMIKGKSTDVQNVKTGRNICGFDSFSIRGRRATV